MAVRINPKMVPELEGRSAFGFRTKRNFHQNTKYGTVVVEKIETQVRAVGQLQLALERFATRPCEVQLALRAHEGHTTLEGEVNAYDQSSMDQTEVILAETDVILHRFAQQFPRSSLTVTFTQSVTIAKGYPQSDQG